MFSSKCLVFVIAGLLVGALPHPTLTLSVAPKLAPIDAPLAITVTHAPPHGFVDIAATIRTNGKIIWSSHARFVADAHGAVDVRRDAPVSGDYRGAHAMGLVWSMRQMTRAYPGLGSTFPKPITYVITATTSDGAAVSTAVTRELVSSTTTCDDVRQPGIVAYVCRPSDGRAHPGVIVLGGSEGGMQQRTASLLASHGFATMALAYFGTSGLPTLLRAIPVETVGRGLAWFARQPYVERDRIGVLGGSKGGELALLSATVYPQIHAVVSEYGSPFVWYGWRGSASQPPTSSWTIAGRALPYIPYAAGPPHLPGIDAPQFMPLEKIRGPVLFISGDDDREWPSSRMAAMAMQRLREHRHGYDDRSIILAHAGHGFSAPYYPAELIVPLGGTIGGNAAASKIAWSDVLQFFAQHL